jgi:hypothetical protein
MRQVVSRAFCFLSQLLLLVPACYAGNTLRINQSRTNAELRDGEMLVSLGVENAGPQPVRAHVEIELVDPGGQSRGKAARDQEFPVGASQVKLEVPLPNVKSGDLDSVFWYRLRYNINASASPGASVEPMTGILSISEIAPEMFELHLAYPSIAKLGANLQAIVRAVQPVTSRPVAGVKVQATLNVSNTDSIEPLKASAVTDARGYATVEFFLPAKADSDKATIQITGRREGYTAKIDDDEIGIVHFTTFLLNTDKPLYQPGQTLHSRALAFGPDRRAAADEPFELRIYDSEDTLVYKANLKTSRFGIASADWPIPANQRLGTYSLRADFGEEDSEDGGGFTTVQISRYELPNFAVAAKPDRAYYLPDQNAAVEVHAAYLFGQPVSRGHVRVVRESDRQWNFREQKWDVDEGEVYEGETDSSGRFVAKVDLAEEGKEVLGEDFRRFRDFNYTAYFTDPTTGRTEHRRFDLRVTKDPVHIYIISAGTSLRSRVVDFYVSTYYADGTPAPCDVTIRTAETKSPDGLVTDPSKPLRTVHTNRYGLAKVFGLAIPDQPGGDEEEASLVFHAADAKGSGGTHTEDFRYGDSPGLRVATDKTLYGPGDPIDVRLTSDVSDATAVVEVVGDWRFFTSQIVYLHNGRGAVMFPPNDKFQGPVTIAAYEIGLQPAEKYGETSAYGERTILFPHDTSLQLDVHMSKATYRPGDEARADFRVNSAGGDSEKGALGLVVVDKAVEQRQRTDEDLRRDSGFYAYRSYWESDSDISGIRRSDLDKLDLSKQLPEDLELVAEVLFARGYSDPRFEDSAGAGTNLHKLFATAIDPPLAPVFAALQSESQAETPEGEAGIRRFLGTTPLASLRDPWGSPYRASISPNRANYTISIESAGPDQKFDTRDDFEAGSSAWPYFAQYDLIIQKAVADYHSRTGGYIRDAATLKTELLARGLDLDSLRDPWGHAYHLEFGIYQNSYTVEIKSAGPDGRFNSSAQGSYDDVSESVSWTNYFDAARLKMQAAIDRSYRAAGIFPQNDKDLADAFRTGGVDWDSLRDPWGHRYYATFRKEARYGDKVTVQSYAEYLAGQHTTIHPVTSEFNFIDIRSAGPDGKEGTPDDFEAAEFSRSFDETPGGTQANTAASPVFSGELGAISGIVTDPSGASIAGAHALAKRESTEATYEALCDGEGKFLLRNLRPGLYQVTFTSPGFSHSVFTAVPVNSSAVTQLNATLQVGSVSQTVTVEAAVEPIQTQSTTLASAKSVIAVTGTLARPVASLSTPRLREYFPETLLWQPELVTDSHGAAHLTFPLADSITTWKLSAIASTVDGRIGTAEKEVRAFQPFFADQDLPQFLTAGDEISLPVVVRNYLDRAEQVELKLNPQPWLALLGPATQHTEVAANDSVRVIFPMRAEAPVKDGKQRVTATGKTAADAIEKKTTVRPFGDEKSVSASQVFESSALLNLSIPANALPGSFDAELKIYPNLMAHVWEAIEAILERPYGCGEQTISSTYPSILLLRYAKQAGRESSPETARARRYAQLGYDRLLSFAAPSGGFTYWGRGDTDLALTAYALMFLNDAKDVIPVDDSVAQKARTWLLNQIRPDGHWVAPYWEKNENLQRSAILTAYIARVLANTTPRPADNASDKQLAALSDRELASALAWLGSQSQQQDEPYLIASYALALLDSGSAVNRDAASKVLDRLQSLAHTEGESSYWSLETNTPFYGWGRAGRLETTALTVEALERRASADPTIDQSAIERGILFLLRNQDRYGIWYSTQATINVLRALAFSISAPASAKFSASEATVLVDGKPAATIYLPPGNELSAPVTADVSKFLGPGDHRIEISRPAGAPKASVQLAESYYVPWTGDAAAESMHREGNSAEALRLTVTYDKTKAKIGEQISCAVKAERVDFRGYGMMLAEIGLPPGAEVDRASLDKAMTASGWDINQFDVLPDRVIVYLWPHAGGTTFTFAFKTRFGIDAETARSVLYDYYNPDAQAIVAPIRLVAK